MFAREVKHYKIRGIWLTIDEEKMIRAHLQGAVRAWCKTRPGEWFSARELLGGVNYDWRGTAIQVLPTKYQEKGKSVKDSISLAGKAVGTILKRVLDDDPRKFEIRDGFKTKEYCWTGGKREGVPKSCPPSTCFFRG